MMTNFVGHYLLCHHHMPEIICTHIQFGFKLRVM